MYTDEYCRCAFDHLLVYTCIYLERICQMCLEETLIVNLVKPFNVRVVLDSKSCPAAGEV